MKNLNKFIVLIVSLFFFQISSVTADEKKYEYHQLETIGVLVNLLDVNKSFFQLMVEGEKFHCAIGSLKLTSPFQKVLLCSALVGYEKSNMHYKTIEGRYIPGAEKVILYIADDYLNLTSYATYLNITKKDQYWLSHINPEDALKCSGGGIQGGSGTYSIIPVICE